MFGYYLIYFVSEWFYTKVYIPFREIHAIFDVSEIYGYAWARIRQVGGVARAPPH